MDGEEVDPSISRQSTAPSLFSFRHGGVQIKVTHRDELAVGKVPSHCMALVRFNLMKF